MRALSQCGHFADRPPSVYFISSSPDAAEPREQSRARRPGVIMWLEAAQASPVDYFSISFKRQSIVMHGF
jgi:hypothetical protein